MCRSCSEVLNLRFLTVNDDARVATGNSAISNQTAHVGSRPIRFSPSCKAILPAAPTIQCSWMGGVAGERPSGAENA